MLPQVLVSIRFTRRDNRDREIGFSIHHVLKDLEPGVAAPATFDGRIQLLRHNKVAETSNDVLGPAVGNGGTEPVP